MQDILVRAKKHQAVSIGKKHAIYYNMLSEYYDILLDGFYDTDNQDEEQYSIRCDAIEKTLFYSKQNISYDINHFVCKKYFG